MAKTQRRRCANVKCGKQYRFEQTSSRTCSDACRQAVYRQRQADNEAEAVAQAQAIAEAALKEKVRKLQAHLEQVRAKRRAAVAEEERERYQAAVKEDAEAERRRKRYAPTYDDREVVIVTDMKQYSSKMTPIPADQKPAWR